MNFEKLAVAPINWTNDDPASKLGDDTSFEQCISEMQIAGYKGTEIGRKFPKDAHVLKEMLEEKNLKVCNQWFEYELTSKPYETVQNEFLKMLKFLKILGTSSIGGAEVGSKCILYNDSPLAIKNDKFTPDQWKKLCKGLNDLGKIACDEGFYLAYHHHMGTGVQSIEDIEILFNETDSRYVFLNYDSGHLYFAGQDPLVALQKFVSRVKHVHLKDVRKDRMDKSYEKLSHFCKAVADGVFTVPGDGVIDFKPIINLLDENKYDRWYVVEAEQDPSLANALEYAKKAMSYLKAITN